MGAGSMGVTSVARAASMRRWCWTARSSRMRASPWAPGALSTCQPGMWPSCSPQTSTWCPRLPRKPCKACPRLIPLMAWTGAEAAPQHQARWWRAMEQLALTCRGQFLQSSIQRQPAQQRSVMERMPAAPQATTQAVHQPGLKSTWYLLSPTMVPKHLSHRSSPHLQLAPCQL